MRYNHQFFKSKFKITVTRIEELKHNVFKLEDVNKKQYIYKELRVDTKKRWSDKTRFKNEQRVYKCLRTHDLKYLNTPKLIAKNDSAILIEYLDRDKDIDISKIDIENFINAYIDLQTLKIKKNFLLDIKQQFHRGFFYQTVISPLLNNNKRLNTRTKIKIIRFYFKIWSRNIYLSRRYWLHGDITSTNVFINKYDSKLYFIDFENMYFTRKWPLIEVIERCLSHTETGFQFKSMPLQLFLNNSVHFENDLQKINLEDQIRFSLFVTCISNILVTKNKEKRNIFLHFLNTVISDTGFQQWYQSYVTMHHSNPSLLKDVNTLIQ